MATGKRARVRSSRCGFTLIEVLVVAGIVALLISILTPSLNRARKQTRSAVCLSNLRQFVIAAHAYGQSHQDRYPIGYYFAFHGNVFTSYTWDFTVVQDFGANTTVIKPGLLWQGGRTMAEIHQCPSFDGASNSAGDPYTGYNYNTSYIGHGGNETISEPAKIASVRRPDRCALFGDGEYANGANKFMRAPWSSPQDGCSALVRRAGTQGYRHLTKTNVAFCDGHAQSWRERHTDTYRLDGESPDDEVVAPGTGFLSSDNSLYDLK